MVEPNGVPWSYYILKRIGVDLQKIEVIENWEHPITIFEVQSFLGLANYYTHLIDGFSTLALPLTRLSKKATKSEWSHDCEKNFHELKCRLITAPILALPTPGKDYEVVCDASHQGLRCVSMQ